MIIRLLKRPLPRHGDERATWKDLNQDALTKMMRVSKVSRRQSHLFSRKRDTSDDGQMTYHIVAPLLYDEVVVDNYSVLVRGIDDPVESHHQDCLPPIHDHSHICGYLIRNRERPYECSRHFRTPPHTDLSGQPRSGLPSAALYHKQELLRMTKALHFVYSKEDEKVYDDFHHAPLDRQDEAMIRLFSLADLQRYDRAGATIVDLPLEFDLMPNLDRMTLGSWLSDKWDARHALSTSFGDDDRLSDFEIFEEYVAERTYGLFPKFVCRHTSVGPFAHYPWVDDVVLPVVHKVVHKASIDTYGRSLIPGSCNVVHFEGSVGSSALDDLTLDADIVARQLASAVGRWLDAGVPQTYIDETLITYCLHRSTEDESQRRNLGREHQDLISVKEMLQDQLDTFEEVLSEGWYDKYIVTWADKQGSCEACGIQYGNVEDVWEEGTTEGPG